jgi:hypothetical protein
MISLLTYILLISGGTGQAGSQFHVVFNKDQRIFCYQL